VGALTKSTTRFITIGDSYTVLGFDAAHDIVTGAATGVSMYGMGLLGDYITAAVGAGSHLASGTGAATGGAASTGAAQTATFEVFKAAGKDVMNKTVTRKILSNILMGGAKGAFSASITETAESAMRDETWDQEFLDSVQTIMKDVKDSAVSASVGWMIGSAASQIGALASESVMTNLKLRMAENLARGKEFSDEELREAGNDILGDDAQEASDDAIRSAGYHKLLVDLGDDYLSNTTEGKVLAASVNNAVSRGVAAYPRSFANQLSQHRIWENGILTGMNQILTGASTGLVRDIGIRTITSASGIGGDELGVNAAQKTALTNIVRRGLSATA